MDDATFDPAWVTTRDFAGVVPVSMYHREQEADPEDPVGIRNYHVLARAGLRLDDGVGRSGGRALVRITADDHYKLYVNGSFVGEGPAPGYPEHQYYDAVDVTALLHPGENVLAVHLYYQGLLNRVWNSRDGRMGLAADVLLLGEEGSASGGSVARRLEPAWRHRVSDAYGMGETVGYDTQFLEHFDSRAWDEGWAREGLDDAAWEPMVPATWADYRLEPRPTRPLEHHELEPRRVERLGAAGDDGVRGAGAAGSVVRADFGREVTGTLVLRACGAAGDVMTIRCGEELAEDGSVRYQMRCNCTYEETWTLADGACELDQYDYKAFRYVELVVPCGVELGEVRAVERHYPLDESLCTLESSDRWLPSVFSICKRGVELCTQEGYVDCPSREKGQYLGDSVVVSHAQALLSGSTEMMEKCIEQFAQSAELADDGLMGVAPGSLMQEIADFSLLWGQMLVECYRLSGRREVLARHYVTARGVIRHFARYARADGLLEQVSDKWNLVDWPENLRDGYDFPLTRPVVAPGCHNVINALWVGAARTLCEIEDVLGLVHELDWRPLRDAYVRAFLRPGTGLFKDSETSPHSALHSNLYTLFFGLCDPAVEARVADWLVGRGMSCGVLASYFYLKGLARAGRHRDVVAAIVNESEHGWVNMLREGATTCWEAWGKDQKWNTSLCHAWACAPIPVLVEDVAGLVPDPSCPRGFRFEPHVPEELGELVLTVPFRGTLWRIRKGPDTGGEARCEAVRTL